MNRFRPQFVPRAGAILAAGQEGTMIQVFGFIAVVLATINVIGGFMVTNRMLAMFKRK